MPVGRIWIFLAAEAVPHGAAGKNAASLVILVLGFMLVHQQIIEPFDFSHSYTDEGVAYEIKDDEQGSLAAYVQALEIDPKYLRALIGWENC